MCLKTYIVQYTHSNGNGWAIINCPSPSSVENILKNQSKMPNVQVVSYKELRYFGEEMGLVYEGCITTIGQSPYDIAVANGFRGSVTEWLDSLKGKQGPQGEQGPQGPQGIQGIQGEVGPKGNDGQDGIGIPSGGLAGQVLKKKSNSDYDTEWGEGGGVGNVNSVNGKTGDVVLNANDVDALPANTEYQSPINDLESIRSGAQSGAAAYQKPNTGIPSTDLSSAVQVSLRKADSALQTETDPTVPSWAKQSSKPTYTAQEVGALPDDTPLFSGDYNDLGNKPTIPTALSQLSEDSTHRVVSDAEKTTWNNKSNFSGSYNDLTDKPDIPVIPTNVSAFNNDAGYLTEHQDISGKEDMMSIVSVPTGTTALSAEVGKYYAFADAVETVGIALPVPADVTKVRTIVFYLTTGTTPAITFSSAAPVYYHNGFELQAGKTYEVNALFNGVSWVIASVEIVIPTNNGD